MSQTVMRKNKIHTMGYVLKRLRDSGFITLKIFKEYAAGDPRRWTLLVDPGDASVFITCYENLDFLGEIMFEMHDGGRRFPRNYSVKTDSVEVIISNLVDRGVSQNADKSAYFKER